MSLPLETEKRTTHLINNLELERAFLVGAQVRGGRPLLGLAESLEELALLADTAGMQVVGQATQLVHSIDPATYIGSGKLIEIIESVQALDAQTVIFDDELTPRHQREIGKALGEKVKLLDRSALILDIFAQHARTREGALQVELAQYEYRLPRLTRQWTHLARLGGGASARGGNGGVGLRGPGETQLESDKREIQQRITLLKQELEEVRKHRRQHRQQRQKTGIPVVAIVGYTNAGKSTLLNALADANVYVADQLFATLDPTTRRVELPSNREVLFTDTVGFIQKLPTTLIAAFRATLEEIMEADILLHVVDVSHPNVVPQIEAVEDTLAELDIPDMPRVLVWNKMDKWTETAVPTTPEASLYDFQVCVSARKKQGLDGLLETVEAALKARLKPYRLLLPYERGDLLPQLFRSAYVHSQDHTEAGVVVHVELPLYLVELYRPYIFNGA